MTKEEALGYLRQYVKSKNNILENKELQKLQEEYPFIKFSSNLGFGTIQFDELGNNISSGYTCIHSINIF